MIGRFLEALELLAFAYPKVFRDGDRSELEQVDAHWAKIELKTKTYVESLGATWAAPQCSGAKKPGKKRK